MRHRWILEDAFWGQVIHRCTRCNGFRVADDDYSGCGKLVNAEGQVVGHIDGPPMHNRLKWRYDWGTPRSCPGTPIDFDAILIPEDAQQKEWKA
jgi:hypothetical protein